MVIRTYEKAYKMYIADLNIGTESAKHNEGHGNNSFLQAKYLFD